jgi:hypothetical protein
VPAADLVVVVGGVGFEVVEVVGAVGVELGVPAEARERDVGRPERVAQVVDDAGQSDAVGGPGGDGPPDPLPERIEEREARNMIFLNYRCALYR